MEKYETKEKWEESSYLIVQIKRQKNGGFGQKKVLYADKRDNRAGRYSHKNIYAPNNTASKYTQKKLKKNLQREMNKLS